MPKAPADPSWITDDGDPDALLSKVLEHFRQCYRSNDKAQQYMAQRGLDDPRLIERFGVGFADGSLGKRLPPSTWNSGKAIRAALKSLGILRASGHGHFDGCVVFTITNPSGKVIDLYGRKITKGLRRGSAYHVFQRDQPPTLFNLAGLAGATEAILCASVIDALSFWVAGYHNVVAVYGQTGFSENHLAALVAHNIQQVKIAFRRSAEGRKTTNSVASKLMEAGIDAYQICFPNRQDANDFLVGNPPAERTFGQVIRAATWLGQGQRPTAPTQAEHAPNADRPSQLDKPPQATKAAKVTNGTDAPAAGPSSSDHPSENRSDQPSHPVASDTGTKEEEPEKDEVVMVREGRRYRVRGLANNLSYSALKINLMVSTQTGFHVDSLDLYVARQRTAFVKQAAGELHVPQDTIKGDLGRLILKLEEIQDQRIEAALKADKPTPLKLTEEERSEAMKLLRAPKLIDRIQADFEATGMIGETTNRLLAYLAATSRKLDQPLAVVIQSSSSAGKSALMNHVLSFMPPEEMLRFSAMTAQSLYYLGESDLKHRILAIAEEEGAERASYALKLLQSEGELVIATTARQGSTGRIKTVDYRVEGPVMILLTTTAAEVDEELMNRCIVLAVDEGTEQTKAIHDQQRHLQTLEGLLQHRARTQVRDTHRNAQRLLRPLLVVNPYAEQLTFLHDRTRSRRDHQKYLALIQAIALLHQYQRTTKSVVSQGQRLEYIEVTPDDIKLANQLAAHALGRCLDDLAPQTRRLLIELERFVADQHPDHDSQADDPEHLDQDGEDRVLFSRRDVMKQTGWTYRQASIHLRRLVELEYLAVRRSHSQHRYELLHPASNGNGNGRTLSFQPAEALERPQQHQVRRGINHHKDLMYLQQNPDVPPKDHPGGTSQTLDSTEDSAGCTAEPERDTPPYQTRNPRRTGSSE